MRITRRSLLVGAGSGAVAMLLASCVSEGPDPDPTPTEPDVTPTPSQDVPAPAGFVRSEWTTDPHSRGARAFVPAGSGEADRAVLAEPIQNRVFFAGDGLGSPIGTMQGASSDGLRAAALVADTASPGERVMVVGAGIAGARAARFLADAGLDVTVIEGRDRTGGRIRTVDLDDWPVAPQLGTWLTDSDAEALHQSLAQQGIVTHELEGETARGPEGAADVPPLDPVRAAIDRAAELSADAALSDALVESGADVESAELVAALAYLTDRSGAEAAELSSWYPPTIPDEPVALSGDLGAVVDEAVDDLTISLQTTVLGVAYDRDGVSLRLSTGEALSADRVILTTPIGVLRHGSIEFEPALPFPYRTAIDSVASGAVETVWLRFDEPFWQASEALWHVVDGDAAVRTWINLQPSTGEPILVGLIGGDAARAFAEMSDDEAAQAAVDSLAFFAEAPADES
ncbi:flavin monoamine oxidase family protein [Microbacterium sp. JB110]|uniref:flavin monoamine oxidase family protein n=1 Tax=Microbacterium sp. JB110 TaxID=2024477 RepID=UPI00097F2B91|nr:NAD(P)/FAD-dependent oxidoreductase [Microbacterium sp. JB110]RCS57253.1 FAD-binding protein [Microbacterium sp. JB110]SJM58923.1 amine oxidase [Frigoribacterium sp. JB110]